VFVMNLRTLWVVYWVNVSESSGVSSRGLSQIKGCYMLVVVVGVDIWPRCLATKHYSYNTRQ